MDQRQLAAFLLLTDELELEYFAQCFMMILLMYMYASWYYEHLECVEMEVGGSSSSQNRRSWSKEEEDALLDILEDVVAHGQRCDTDSFESETITLIERQFAEKCPQSNLRSSSHIESKLKIWKKQFSIIFDMLNKSGFGWNDQLKCLEVDSDDVWIAYVQSNKSAEGWRGRFFPVYERLANIFENDRASINMKTTNEPNTDWGITDENSLMSVNQNNFHEPEASQRSGRKRARSRNDFVTEFGNVASQLIKQLDERFHKSEANYPKYLAEELDRLGFDMNDNLTISMAMMSDPSNVEVFKRGKTDDDKIRFAWRFLDDSE